VSHSAAALTERLTQEGIAEFFNDASDLLFSPAVFLLIHIENGITIS